MDAEIYKPTDPRSMDIRVADSRHSLGLTELALLRHNGEAHAYNDLTDDDLVEVTLMSLRRMTLTGLHKVICAAASLLADKARASRRATTG